MQNVECVIKISCRPLPSSNFTNLHNTHIIHAASLPKVWVMTNREKISGVLMMTMIIIKFKHTKYYHKTMRLTAANK